LYDYKIDEMIASWFKHGFLGCYSSNELDKVAKKILELYKSKALNKTDHVSFIMNLNKSSGLDIH
jgi:hypothetical protein